MLPAASRGQQATPTTNRGQQVTQATKHYRETLGPVEKGQRSSPVKAMKREPMVRNLKARGKEVATKTRAGRMRRSLAGSPDPTRGLASEQWRRGGRLAKKLPLHRQRSGKAQEKFPRAR